MTTEVNFSEVNFLFSCTYFDTIKLLIERVASINKRWEGGQNLPENLVVSYDKIATGYRLTFRNITSD
jgi:hypothetical protein